MRSIAAQLIFPSICSLTFIVIIHWPPILSAVLNQRSNNRNMADEDLRETCHMRELELCSVGLMSIFQNPNGLPMSEVELKRQCEYLNESVQCFDDYKSRCLTQNQFSVVNLFTNSSFQLASEFCRIDSPLRQNYTKHVGCFRDVQRKFQRPCMIDFQVGFESISKLNRSRRLTTACCNVNRLKECIFEPIDYECGLSATYTVEQVLETAFGSVFGISCRNYNSTNDECERILPPIDTKPHNGRNISALSKIISSFTNVPSQL